MVKVKDRKSHYVADKGKNQAPKKYPIRFMRDVLGCNQRWAEKAYDAFGGALFDTLAQGYALQIQNFGIFSIHYNKNSKIQNAKMVTFRPSWRLKCAINDWSYPVVMFSKQRVTIGSEEEYQYLLEMKRRYNTSQRAYRMLPPNIDEILENHPRR